MWRKDGPLLKQKFLAALAVSASGILLALFSPHYLRRKDTVMSDQSCSDPMLNIGLSTEEVLLYRYLCTLAHMSTGKHFPCEITRETILRYIQESSARYCPECFRWYSNDVTRCVYCVLPHSTIGIVTKQASQRELCYRVLAWEQARQELIAHSGVAYTRADIIRMVHLASHKKNGGSNE